MTSMDEFYAKLEKDIDRINKRKIEARQFMELLVKCPGCGNHIEFSLGGCCIVCLMRVHIDHDGKAYALDPVGFET